MKKLLASIFIILSITAFSYAQTKINPARLLQGATGGGSLFLKSDNSGNVSFSNNLNGSVVSGLGDAALGSDAVNFSLFQSAVGFNKSNATTGATKVTLNNSSETFQYRDLFTLNSNTGNTGFLSIECPFGMVNNFLHFTIKGYDYSTLGAWELKISFHNYGGGYFANPSGELIGKASFDIVRLGLKNSKVQIMLGDISTNWIYSKVWISEAAIFGSNAGNFLTGYSSSFNTDLTGFSAVTQVYVDKKNATYTDSYSYIKLQHSTSTNYTTLLQNQYDGSEPFFLSNQGSKVLGVKSALNGTYLANYNDVSIATGSSNPVLADVKLVVKSSGAVVVGSTTDNTIDKLRVHVANSNTAFISVGTNNAGSVATPVQSGLRMYGYADNETGRIAGLDFSANYTWSGLAFSTRNNSSVLTERARFMGPNGNLVVNQITDNGVDRLQINGSAYFKGGASMTGGWSRVNTIEASFPVFVFNSNNVKFGGIGYDNTVGYRFWANSTTNDVSGNGTEVLRILNDGSSIFFNSVSVGNASASTHALNQITADGRYLGITATATNSGALNGQNGFYYRNASNINTGTLADAQLSANVPLLNADNAFSGRMAIGGAIDNAYRVNVTGNMKVSTSFDVGTSITAALLNLTGLASSTTNTEVLSINANVVKSQNVKDLEIATYQPITLSSFTTDVGGGVFKHTLTLDCAGYYQKTFKVNMSNNSATAGTQITFTNMKAGGDYTVIYYNNSVRDILYDSSAKLEDGSTNFSVISQAGAFTHRFRGISTSAVMKAF